MAASRTDAPAPKPVAGRRCPGAATGRASFAPVAQFTVDEVLKPDVVRPFLESLSGAPGVGRQAAVVQQARDGKLRSSRPTTARPRRRRGGAGVYSRAAPLQKKQYAQAGRVVPACAQEASDFLGAAFFLGAVHAATGRDNDAVGAWQMSLIGDGGASAYPLLVDGPAARRRRAGGARHDRRSARRLAERRRAAPPRRHRAGDARTVRACARDPQRPAQRSPTTSICCSSRFRCSTGSSDAAAGRGDAARFDDYANATRGQGRMPRSSETWRS